MSFGTLQFMHDSHKKNQNLSKCLGRHNTAMQCYSGPIMHTFPDGGRFRPRKGCCYCWLLMFPASWRSTDASCRPVGPLQATWSFTETDDVYTVHLLTFTVTEFWVLLLQLDFSFSALNARKIWTGREKQLSLSSVKLLLSTKRHVIMTQSQRVSVFRNAYQN